MSEQDTTGEPLGEETERTRLDSVAD